MSRGREISLNRFETKQMAVRYLEEKGYRWDSERALYRSGNGAQAHVRELGRHGTVQVLIIPSRPAEALRT
jgi:hypothetical protein